MQMPNLKEAKKRTKKKVNTYQYTIDPSLKKIGKNKKYFIKTYGCQMNEHDSENIKAIFKHQAGKKIKTERKIFFKIERKGIFFIGKYF